MAPNLFTWTDALAQLHSSGNDEMDAVGWLSGVAVACQRCRASDRGSVPGFASGR